MEIYTVIVTDGYEVDSVQTFETLRDAEIAEAKLKETHFKEWADRHGVSPYEYQDTEHWWDDDNRTKVTMTETILTPNQPKCLYCDEEGKEEVEPSHYICQECGDGMCDACFDAGEGHGLHTHNPAELAETPEMAEKLSMYDDGYLCERCYQKALTQ